MTWFSIVASLLYKVADWLWEKHKAKMKARGAPLTNAEENSAIDKLPDAE